MSYRCSIVFAHNLLIVRFLNNDLYYLARRGKRVDRRRHDNDATTKADKRGRRLSVTTRRKIRGVAAGVCRISRGRRERTARSEASRHWYWLRGKTAPSATLCRCPQGLASHRRDTRRIAREILRSRRPWIFASLSRLQRSIPSLAWRGFSILSVDDSTQRLFRWHFFLKLFDITFC